MARSNNRSSKGNKEGKDLDKKAGIRSRCIPSGQRHQQRTGSCAPEPGSIIERYVPGGMSSLLDSINEAVLLTYFTGKHLCANASYDAVVRKLKMKDLLELGCRESNTACVTKTVHGAAGPHGDRLSAMRR